MLERCTLPTTFSRLSENVYADSVHLGSEHLFTAQQDSSLSYSEFTSGTVPYSPLPDSAHPWDDAPLLLHESTPAYSNASSQEHSTSSNLCETCNVSFTSASSLKRHVETVHKLGETYWVCTVKSCPKYDKPEFRKDNFRRHCRRKHPTINLKAFGL